MDHYQIGPKIVILVAFERHASGDLQSFGGEFWVVADIYCLDAAATLWNRCHPTSRARPSTSSGCGPI